MRILIATETYPPNVNGSALATERMAKRLAEKGHSVSVVAPSTSFRHFKTNQGKITIYRLRSILVQKTQKLRVSPQLLHYREFHEIMMEVKPDIIHINNPGFIAQTAITTARKFRVPIIGTSHFMAENLTHYLRLPDQMEKILNTSVWKMYARFYSRLNLIISPTQTAANLLKRLKVNTKIQVISNGLDLKKFNPNNNGDYIKKRFKLPNKLTILFLGRIDKEKNIDILIKAVALLKDKIDFQTVIVGKGKEDRPLKKLADSLGVKEKVIFTGYLPKDDLHNVYKIADIFVMPGTAELQSLVTMEAMACGLPVVGANAVALPHLIHSKKNGFLFKPGNEKDLAEKLFIVLNDPELRKKMGKESLEIISHHNIDDVIVKVEKVYKQVIEDYQKNPYVKKNQRREVLRRLKKLSIKRFIPQELKV
jgi:1,2-diacylglycerol 3-alpha-glucosyltransferase